MWRFVLYINISILVHVLIRFTSYNIDIIYILSHTLTISSDIKYNNSFNNRISIDNATNSISFIETLSTAVLITTASLR